MTKKRKNVVRQAEEPETKSEDMELETALDNVLCNVDQPTDAMHHSSIMEVVETDIFYKVNPSYSKVFFFTANLKI
jgi:hypothetical protein